MRVPLLLAALFAATPVGFAQTSFYASGVWGYWLNDSNEATIYSYSGQGGDVVVPSSLDGRPVKSVGPPRLSGAHSGNSSVTSVTIPDGVTNIGAGAFSMFTGLTNVIIPDSVTSIGEYAFNGCAAMRTVTIPNGVTNIGAGAFSSCRQITNAVLGNNVAAIGDWAFYDCDGLTNIVISPSVATIGSNAFSDCLNLANATIEGNGATVIGRSSFWYARKLTNVIIGDGVAKIEFGAFGDCGNLRSLKIGNGVAIIGPLAFYRCGLTNLVIPHSVTNIGTNAFGDCTNLISAKIGRGLTTIARNLFEGCTNMTSVILGRNVARVEGDSFRNCSRLERIYFLNSAPPPQAESAGGPWPTPEQGGASPWGLFGDPVPQSLEMFYRNGSPGWGPTLGGRPTRIFSAPFSDSFIVEHPRPLDDPPASSFMIPDSLAILGVPGESLIYAIRNTSETFLNNIVVTNIGNSGSEFLLVPTWTNSIAPGKLTQFRVSFSPSVAGFRMGQLSVSSDDTNSPLYIIVSGFGLTEDLDTDGDGLNDAAEFTMSPLGFNWQSNQPTLVTTLYNNANRALLFNQSQYNSNRSNGQTDVTQNPASFGLVTQLQFDGSRLVGRQDVIANPMSYGLYDSNSIMDLRMGALMIQKQGTDSTIVFQTQTTTDLAQPFTNNGTPITNTIPMPGNKGFIRIHAKPNHPTPSSN